MHNQQFTYSVRTDVTPFSVTPGGFANFSAQNTLSDGTDMKIADTHIVWTLRDTATNAEFAASQHVIQDHAALYCAVISEQPLKNGAIYETIKVTMPAKVREDLKSANSSQSACNQRIGIARGTHVMTSRGELPVEKLETGDKVITRDHGMQVVRHVGKESRNLSGINAPVMFRAGSIKNSRDLVVSADHRIVLKGAAAINEFGVKEVLVPACHLIDGETVVQGIGGKMDFFQIVTDQHEVIYTEAAATESFMPDEAGLTALSAQNRAQMISSMPILKDVPNAYGPSARRFMEKSAG